VHAQLFAFGGAYVIGAVVGGALVILLSEWLRQRRTRVAAAPRAAA
jgi:hypothetical protein